MPQPTVNDILELIGQLGDEDRRTLERRLSERHEAEWQAVLDEGRRIARERGISEEAVDQIIHRRRYGG